jgi:hypothetical protein
MAEKLIQQAIDVYQLSKMSEPTVLMLWLTISYRASQKIQTLLRIAMRRR